jgi:hypothetical protein
LAEDERERTWEGWLTPEGHEDGEEDSGRVVKEMAGPGRAACGLQLPVAASAVTQWAHGDVVSRITNLHAACGRRTFVENLSKRDLTIMTSINSVTSFRGYRVQQQREMNECSSAQKKTNPCIPPVPAKVVIYPILNFTGKCVRISTQISDHAYAQLLVVNRQYCKQILSFGETEVVDEQ